LSETLKEANKKLQQYFGRSDKKKFKDGVSYGVYKATELN